MKLQKFDFDKSSYERPNAHWRCGRKGGCPCALGPDKQGRCQEQEKPCRPVRTVRSKRLLTSVIIFLLSLIIVLLSSIQEPTDNSFISPGQLTKNHGHILAEQSCSACHSVLDLKQSSKHPEIANSQSCIACHFESDQSLHPHNADPSRLVGHSREEAFQKQVACTQCHVEHKGQFADIKALSNKRCQSCHEEEFESFEKGHPEFSAYAKMPKKSLKFQHNSKDHKSLTDCRSCHTESVGGVMEVKSFEQMCSTCHTRDLPELNKGQISLASFFKASRSSLKDFYGDLKSMKAKDSKELIFDSLYQIRKSQGLSFESDLQITQVFPGLSPKDLPELKSLSAKEKKEVLLKKVIFHPENQSTLGLDKTEKLKLIKQALAFQGLGEELSESSELYKKLFNSEFSEELIEEFFAHYDDFEEEGDFAIYEQAYEDILTLFEEEPLAKVRYIKLSSSQSFKQIVNMLCNSDLAPMADDLGAIDSFDEIDDAKVKSVSQEMKAAVNQRELEEYSELFKRKTTHLDEFYMASLTKFVETLKVDMKDFSKGKSWQYQLDKDQLVYKPTGHKDLLIKKLYDTAFRDKSLKKKSQKMINEALSTQEAHCSKCHETEPKEFFVGEKSLAWRTKSEKRVTKFSHFAHKAQDCQSCHQLEPQSGHSFDFKAISKQSCVSCHNNEQAGQSCLQCHNYHADDFSNHMLFREQLQKDWAGLKAEDLNKSN